MLMCLGLLGPGFCDRRCAPGSLCGRLKDLLCSLALMGQPCGPFLSHLSALCSPCCRTVGFQVAPLSFGGRRIVRRVRLLRRVAKTRLLIDGSINRGPEACRCTRGPANGASCWHSIAQSCSERASTRLHRLLALRPVCIGEHLWQQGRSRAISTPWTR